MGIKAILLILVISILMEDSDSIKKSAEEVKEDEEVQRAVNATLAAEEEKRRKEEDEAKKKEENIKEKKEDGGPKKSHQDEAWLPLNCTCPSVKPCPKQGECGPCPEVRPCDPCEECPETRPCQPCDDCGPCPEVRPCKPCRPCGPDGPGSVANITNRGPDLPVPPPCLETSNMSVPVALAVGAAAGVLVTGVAAVLGLVIRYLSPLECGFLILATIVMVWYFSSQHPETARELGGRAATLLREAAAALSHRIVDAIRHHNEQVGCSY
jgi:hypothetical protein